MRWPRPWVYVLVLHFEYEAAVALHALHSRSHCTCKLSNAPQLYNRPLTLALPSLSCLLACLLMSLSPAERVPFLCPFSL